VRLQELVSILKEFPGRDEVSLRVVNESKVTHLSLSGLRVDSCPELREKLAAMLGEESVRVA